MSVILEGSETPTSEGVQGSDGRSESENVLQRSTSQHDNQQNENTEDNGDGERGTEEDTGGGGDTEGGGSGERNEEVKDIDGSRENISSIVTNADDKSSALKEKITESEAASKASSSKKSIDITSKGEGDITSKGDGEGSVSLKNSHHTVNSEVTRTKSSSESFSSGFRIVTQILEELIDSVIEIKTKELAGELESQLTSEETPHTASIVTIKSEDEEGSVEINAELEAQLALEQETAALQRQQTYQENIALYHALIASRVNLKRRNAFLLKQMYEHYKRKKIEHLFKEMPVANVDMEGKYVRVLLAYEEAHKTAIEEEIMMAKIVSSLDEKKQIAESEFQTELENLISREQDIAKGIFATHYTKYISAKDVENLIQRQIAKSTEVAKERLVFFKLRDAAAADESYLKSLENLGDNLTLMEYEQLKMQSQSCVEKLEERDAELHRLRSKATSAIQVLAEIREKTNTLQEDIEAGKVILHDVHQHLIQTRERVGCEKKRRDISRSDTIRLRQEAGLLSEPKLLQDYRESLIQKENLLEQLQEWKSKFESEKQNILSLRRELAALLEKEDGP